MISAKSADTIFILTGGIEWDIAMPPRDIERLPPVGEEGRVFTWLYHREDLMRLYGFVDVSRRATFLELLKVEGIGPKGALKILGGIGQEELEEALEKEDLGRLEAVPGLGKKTAQKMLLALKGKIVRSGPGSGSASPYGELADALVEMGYDRKAAQEALARAAAEFKGSSLGPEKEKALFREAIVYLSGS